MKLRNKKTGEIGYFCFANWNDPVLIIMDKDGVQLGKYNYLAELNEEWEDYEEPSGYWYIDFDGDVLSCVEPFDNETEENRKQIGNYFETKEEAEKAVEKLKAWKRLKDKGFELSAVVDGFFCLDIYMKGEPYEEIKEDLKIVFGGEE